MRLDHSPCNPSADAGCCNYQVLGDSFLPQYALFQECAWELQKHVGNVISNYRGGYLHHVLAAEPCLMEQCLRVPSDLTQVFELFLCIIMQEKTELVHKFLISLHNSFAEYTYQRRVYNVFDVRELIIQLLHILKESTMD